LSDIPRKERGKNLSSEKKIYSADSRRNSTAVSETAFMYQKFCSRIRILKHIRRMGIAVWRILLQNPVSKTYQQNGNSDVGDFVAGSGT
jgi:hypothetical protein